MSNKFSGGCLCGAVRYDGAAEPIMQLHCQCADCRKSSGTGHASIFAVPAESVSISGETTDFAVTADSGNTLTRSHCPTCGSGLFSASSGFDGVVFIKASTLDDPSWFKPTMVIYADSATNWDVVDPELTRFPGMPG